MGRGEKKTVDYFPHKISHGRRMYIIERKFGNDGYATWFKLLEQLGRSEHHYIDLSQDNQDLYLQSVFRIDADTFNQLMTLFCDLEIIESDMYLTHRILFSQEFVQSINEAYKRRNNKLLYKYDLCQHLNIELEGIDKDRYKNPHIKENKTKENKTKEKEVVELYHAICTGLSKIRILTDQRKTTIKARLKEHDIDTIKLVLEKVAASDFCNGKNDRNWYADFDWIFKPSNFVKILEDKYINRKGNTGFKKN